jgi:hypothetical protein
MPHTVFFSWQLDRQEREGRSFVEKALTEAIESIREETSLVLPDREKLSFDSDTRNVPGQPPIVDTIFRKIDDAAVFVADLTFVGTRSKRRPTPNPNVLVEYGWALKKLGHTRIVWVMNEAYGEPTDKNMPFDLRHFRRPQCTYTLPAGAPENEYDSEFASLVQALTTAIGDVLRSDDFRNSLPKPVGPAEFKPYPLEDLIGRDAGTELGFAEVPSVGDQPFKVSLIAGPTIWLRLMPKHDPGRLWRTADIKSVFDRQAQASRLPMIPPINGYIPRVRSELGIGWYQPRGTGGDQTSVFGMVSFRGEIWTMNRVDLGRSAVLPVIEGHFCRVLEECVEFLSALGVPEPYRWEAGMRGVLGKVIAVPPSSSGESGPPATSANACSKNVVSCTGEYAGGDSAKKNLKPLFEEFFESCGMQRPTYLDR